MGMTGIIGEEVALERCPHLVSIPLFEAERLVALAAIEGWGSTVSYERQNEIEEADREINKYAYEAQEEIGNAFIHVKTVKQGGKTGRWFRQKR